MGASVYVDGHRFKLISGSTSDPTVFGINELVRPADVAGIEVYTGLGDLPGEFADPNGQKCGAIATWTRSGG